MAAGPLLLNESLRRYRALGVGGDPVWRSHGQLRAALAARLGRDHADLLAVPEIDSTGQSIGWYAGRDGDVRRLSELDPADRGAVQARLAALQAEIAHLAESMEGPDRSAAAQGFARLLRQALVSPGDDTIFVVGDQPVIAFWSFSADAALPAAFLASPPAAVPRPAAIPEATLASAPAAVAAVPLAARSAWWQWVLLALLLVALLLLLAWLIKPYLPRLEPQLEAAARERVLKLSVQQPLEIVKARANTLGDENERLRLELARLTDELARKGGECAAGVLVPGTGGAVAVAPGTSGAPIAREAVPEARTDGGAGAGASAAGKDESEPKPMVVPPEAKAKQNLGFLKGDWRSRTGLATAQGESDLRPTYALDDKGKGKVSFVQKNGAVCEAPAEARWNGGKLVIEEKANPRCSDGKTYARNTVTCDVAADGAADCRGSQPGEQRSYRVQIGR
ncbi:MAG: hypothetical protein FJX02_07420 [Alphaproteobacteria bacterium]|nr:hypothetical protein [Alphaproteobacteria bacterium]